MYVVGTRGDKKYPMLLLMYVAIFAEEFSAITFLCIVNLDTQKVGVRSSTCLISFVMFGHHDRSILLFIPIFANRLKIFKKICNGERTTSFTHVCANLAMIDKSYLFDEIKNYELFWTRTVHMDRRYAISVRFGVRC